MGHPDDGLPIWEDSEEYKRVKDLPYLDFVLPSEAKKAQELPGRAKSALGSFMAGSARLGRGLTTDPMRLISDTAADATRVMIKHSNPLLEEDLEQRNYEPEYIQKIEDAVFKPAETMSAEMTNPEYTMTNALSGTLPDVVAMLVPAAKLGKVSALARGGSKLSQFVTRAGVQAAASMPSVLSGEATEYQQLNPEASRTEALNRSIPSALAQASMEGVVDVPIIDKLMGAKGLGKVALGLAGAGTVEGATEVGQRVLSQMLLPDPSGKREWKSWEQAGHELGQEFIGGFAGGLAFGGGLNLAGRVGNSKATPPGAEAADTVNAHATFSREAHDAPVLPPTIPNFGNVATPTTEIAPIEGLGAPVEGLVEQPQPSAAFSFGQEDVTSGVAPTDVLPPPTMTPSEELDTQLQAAVGPEIAPLVLAQIEGRAQATGMPIDDFLTAFPLEVILADLNTQPNFEVAANPQPAASVSTLETAIQPNPIVEAQATAQSGLGIATPTLKQEGFNASEALRPEPEPRIPREARVGEQPRMGADQTLAAGDRTGGRPTSGESAYQALLGIEHPNNQRAVNAAPQVHRKLEPVTFRDRVYEPEVSGRLIHFDDTRMPSGENRGGVHATVLPNGDLYIAGIYNDGNSGAGDFLYKRLAETAMAHFPEVTRKSHVFGALSKDSLRARMRYADTNIYTPEGWTEGGVGDTTIGAILDYQNPRGIQYQGKPQQVIRAQFEFDGRKSEITLDPVHSNASSIFHESMHYIERTFTDVEKAEARRLWGNPNKEWGVEQSENLARSYERWNRDGKSPSNIAKGIFQKIREFFRKVYPQLKGSDIGTARLTEAQDAFFRNMLGENGVVQGAEKLRQMLVPKVTREATHKGLQDDADALFQAMGATPAPSNPKRTPIKQTLLALQTSYGMGKDWQDQGIPAARAAQEVKDQRSYWMSGKAGVVSNIFRFNRMVDANPELNPYSDARYLMAYERNKIKKEVIPAHQAVMGLGVEERTTLAYALSKGTREGKVWSASALKSLGLSTQGVEAYEKVREYYRLQAENLIKVMEDKAAKTLEVAKRTTKDPEKLAVAIQKVETLLAEKRAVLSKVGYAPEMREGDTSALVVNRATGDVIGNIRYFEHQREKQVARQLQTIQRQMKMDNKHINTAEMKVDNKSIQRDLPVSETLGNVDSELSRFILDAAIETEKAGGDPIAVLEVWLDGLSKEQLREWYDRSAGDTKSIRFKPRMMKQVGYYGAMMDVPRTLALYAMGVSQEVAIQKHGTKVRAAIRSIQDPDLQKFASDDYDFITRPPDNYEKWAGAIKGLVAFQKLAFKPMYALQQPAQRWTQEKPVLNMAYSRSGSKVVNAANSLANSMSVPTALAKYNPWSNQMTQLVDGMLPESYKPGIASFLKQAGKPSDKASVDKLHADLSTVIQFGEDSGGFDNTYMQEVFESLGDAGYMDGAILKRAYMKVLEAGNFLSAPMESLNRRRAFITDALMTLTGGQAFEVKSKAYKDGVLDPYWVGVHALEMVDRTHNQMGRTGYSRFERGLGGWGTLPLQFKNFTVDFATSLGMSASRMNQALQEDIKAGTITKAEARKMVMRPILKSVATVMVLGGGLGLPMMSNLVQLVGWMFGNDEEDWLQDLERWTIKLLGGNDGARRIARGLFHGIFNAAGLEVGASYSMGDLFFAPDPGASAYEKAAVFGGPVFDEIRRLFQAGQLVSQGNTTKAVKTVVPQGLRGLFDAVPGKIDALGAKHELDPISRLLKGAGINTTKTVKMYEVADIQRRLDYARKNIYSRYANSLAELEDDARKNPDRAVTLNAEINMLKEDFRSTMNRYNGYSREVGAANKYKLTLKGLRNAIDKEKSDKPRNPANRRMNKNMLNNMGVNQ